MSVKITYFVHGTTVDNESGISSGWKDASLSELGIKQGNQLRELTKDQIFDAVFCSDLKRAKDTANLAFSGRALITEDARLRECNYGTFNGSPSEIVEPLQKKKVIERFQEGESYEDVTKRIADFLEFLKNNYNGKNVAIVSHKGPQLALDVLVNNKTWYQAFASDWRKTKHWQPGWNYYVA